MLRLARGLRSRGHEQRIVTPADSALVVRARQEGFDIIPFEGAISLRRHLRECQIVHSHSGRDQTLSFLATAGLPVLRITTRHVAFEPRHPTIHRWKYTNTCDGVVAVSNAVRTTLLNAGVPEPKIEVIPTGVELPSQLASPEERASARAKYRLASEELVAGHLGAFTPEKGQDVAIAAAHILRGRLPQVRMILAGENPRALAAGPNVLLPGFVENRDEFFAALDVFIMPSRSEGWGLAAAEALAHGIPVIASDTGGLREIVEHGETGWLVAPGDAETLASAIVEAVSDPERLRRMGTLARERAERFSCARTAELTESFYYRLLRTERRRP